eukprot:jgi/Tetstr1/434530/TSEL_023621.t1
MRTRAACALDWEAFVFVVCREFWRARVARAFDRPPPLRVEIAYLRRFALVWMPWFMVTGLGLTPFEGPVRRGKMSFLRCLIDGVPWDVFPPGVGMSWWSAEQISRSLDLARTKVTASQGPERGIWSERRTPSRVCCRAAARIDRGQGAGPSGAPPPVFAAEPQPASTVAPAVGKPASTVAPAVGKVGCPRCTFVAAAHELLLRHAK